MKALIKVGYGCNEHCTFCHTADVRHIDGASDEVHRKIRRAKQLGHSMVVLSGGEPTIRPELMEWAAHIDKLGMELGLITNGQMLAYPELVERLRKKRLTYVYMSLHGGTAEIHNRLVRADGFGRTRKAIDNLSGLGLDFSLNAVVTKQNVEHLRSLVDLALEYPDVVLKFSMVQPKGGGANHFELLTPRVSKVAAAVVDAITYGLERAQPGGPRFAHDGIPLCLLPGYEHLYDDLKTHRFATMVEIGEPDFFPVDDKAKLQPDQTCGGCSLRGPCPGLFRGYHDHFGADELRAVTDRPRSNSFDYVFDRVAWAEIKERCPLLDDGVTPWDRGRHLFVERAGSVIAYRSDSRDFSDREMEIIKHDRGQVYIDISDKPAPDDFATDLRKLARSARCTDCPERQSCTGLFSIVEGDVFTPDDERVRSVLRQLSGDVLDIGCGDAPYADVFAELGERVRYVGLDPDAERIANLRDTWPWATLHVGTAEELAERSLGQFDAVLVLRSWNHIADPNGAMEHIAAALRPGGELIVCDNVAFGLARSRDQTHRARQSSAEFEHYRNDTAEEADRVVSKIGLEQIDRLDVGPGTSNQWLLRYRRPA